MLRQQLTEQEEHQSLLPHYHDQQQQQELPQQLQQEEQTSSIAGFSGGINEEQRSAVSSSSATAIISTSINNKETKSPSTLTAILENKTYGSFIDNYNKDNNSDDDLHKSSTITDNNGSNNGDDDGDDISLEASREEEGNDDDDDESEFSYESEYDDDDDDDNDDNNDFDEEEFDDEELGRKQKSNNCLPFLCCGDNNKKRRKKKKRRRRGRQLRNEDQGDSDDLDDDEEDDEAKWKVIFKPVFSPIFKVYQVAKDAIILITNVDDVWDSPALARNRNNSIVSRSRSDTTGSFASLNNSNHHIMGQGGRYGRFSYRNIEEMQGHWYENASLSTESQNRGEDNSRENIGQYVSFRHKVGVLFWFLLLATAYALERGFFKVMVDRMGPFRMVVGAEIVMVLHALILAIGMLIRSFTCGRINAKGFMLLPLTDIGMMAILDSIQLLFAVISGSRVAPILTAVLVHFTIPSSTFLKKLLFASKHQDESNHVVGTMYSQYLFGSTLILIASILAVSPAILTLIYPRFFSSKNVMANRSAWNTILFSLSCIPAAISQIYKEQTLASFAQPVDSTFLNMLLSLFSSVFIFIVSPLFFTLQGLADTPRKPKDGSGLRVQSWVNLYPSRELSQNYVDSLKCFTGKLNNNVQISGYPEEAHCDFAFGFVLIYVLSIITINHAVNKICNAGAIKIMHRSISAGIILSVVLMTYYQIFVDDEDYGYISNTFWLGCAVVLVMGSEVFHRVSLQNPSFETIYPQVGDLYDDE